jgi:hypothetical protein
MKNESMKQTQVIEIVLIKISSNKRDGIFTYMSELQLFCTIDKKK